MGGDSSIFSTLVPVLVLFLHNSWTVGALGCVNWMMHVFITQKVHFSHIILFGKTFSVPQCVGLCSCSKFPWGGHAPGSPWLMNAYTFIFSPLTQEYASWSLSTNSYWIPWFVTVGRMIRGEQHKPNSQALWDQGIKEPGVRHAFTNPREVVSSPPGSESPVLALSVQTVEGSCL